MGLGNTTGDTTRVSGVEPSVSRNQTSTPMPTPAIPTARLTSGGGDSRSVNSRRMSDRGAACTDGGAAAVGVWVVTDSVTARTYFDSSG